MQVINFKLLEKKILNKLNSPIVESDDNAVNLYDLNYAANEVLGKYNKVIYKETNKLKDSFNKLLSSENKRIQSVVPSISNSIPYIIITTSEHVNGKVYFSDILYTENSLSSKSAKKLFKIMNKFVEDNYGLDFTWDQENDKNNTITSSDGFLSYKLDLRNIGNPIIGFVDLDDAFTASLRVPHEGGELGDYIEFYKDAFLKRQSVPIHTIPKQFKNVYLKFQEKTKTLKK